MLSLKPCPCCGDNPVRRPYQSEAADQIHKLEIGVVQCLDCGLKMECLEQSQADMRWNNRVRQKCIHEMVKEYLENTTADYEASAATTESKGDK